MKTVIKFGLVLGVCAFLAFAMGSGDNSPKATPAPVVVQNNDVELVKAVGSIVEPVIVASAKSVEADRTAAHPPSTYDQWGATLTALCVVSCTLTAMVIVALAWIVTRQGALLKLINALERIVENRSEQK